MAFVTIQEGCASGEYYLSVWDTFEAAEEFRNDCSMNEAYRTTDVIEMDDDIDWNKLEEWVQSLGCGPATAIPDDVDAHELLALRESLETLECFEPEDRNV